MTAMIGVILFVVGLFVANLILMNRGVGLKT